MDLMEDLLPYADIRCRHFLRIEGIQGWVAVEGKVASIGRDLVAREQGLIVGVIAKARRPLGDVISARHGSRGGRRLPTGQEGAEKCVTGIVMDVELDANRLEVALDDRFASDASLSA